MATGSVNGQTIDTAVLTPSKRTRNQQPTEYFVHVSGSLTGKPNTLYTKIDVKIEYISLNGTTETSLATDVINLSGGSGTTTYQSPAAFKLDPNPPANDKVFARVTVDFYEQGGAKVTKTKDSNQATFPW